LKENGIKHQMTVPYSLEQNGMAAQVNRTVVEKARSVLQDACLGKIYFWKLLTWQFILALAVKCMSPEEV
jgi:hypothetical protein